MYASFSSCWSMRVAVYRARRISAPTDHPLVDFHSAGPASLGTKLVKSDLHYHFRLHSRIAISAKGWRNSPVPSDKRFFDIFLCLLPFVRNLFLLTRRNCSCTLHWPWSGKPTTMVWLLRTRESARPGPRSRLRLVACSLHRTLELRAVHIAWNLSQCCKWLAMRTASGFIESVQATMILYLYPHDMIMDDHISNIRYVSIIDCVIGSLHQFQTKLFFLADYHLVVQLNNTLVTPRPLSLTKEKRKNRFWNIIRSITGNTNSKKQSMTNAKREPSCLYYKGITT
jgi:hypothetical protein